LRYACYITRRYTIFFLSFIRLLTQTEESIEYETLLSLQHNISAFLSATDVELLDIYCCVKLKEDILKCGLKQLQELDTYFRALVAHTETQNHKPCMCVYDYLLFIYFLLRDLINFFNFLYIELTHLICLNRIAYKENIQIFNFVHHSIIFFFFSFFFTGFNNF